MVGDTELVEQVEVLREEEQEQGLQHVPVEVVTETVGMERWLRTRVVYEVQTTFPFLDHPIHPLASMCSGIPQERLCPFPPGWWARRLVEILGPGFGHRQWQLVVSFGREARM